MSKLSEVQKEEAGKGEDKIFEYVQLMLALIFHLPQILKTITRYTTNNYYINLNSRP